MLLCERQQALDGPHALDRTVMMDGLGPGPAGRAYFPATRQEVAHTAVDQPAFQGMDVLVAGRGPAPGSAHMYRDLLHPHVEDPDHARVPAHPHLAPHVFGGDRVEGLFKFDVAIPMHGPFPLGKAREEPRRQRQKRGLLGHDEEGAHLLVDRPVDPRVGHVPLPVGQVDVLGPQAFEATALDRVLLGVVDPGLALALVPRHPRLARQDHRPVKPGKLGQLRVELRIIPVRLQDRGLQVVDHHGPRNPADRPERVLDAAQERLRVLAPHDLRVALSRVA